MDTGLLSAIFNPFTYAIIIFYVDISSIVSKAEYCVIMASSSCYVEWSLLYMLESKISLSHCAWFIID